LNAQPPARILPLLVLSQFAGTSLWFAGNAALPDLQLSMGLAASDVAWVTTAVQLGFIAGTLLFSLLSITDRIAPVRLFLICSLLGATLNGIIPLAAEGRASLLLLRFGTGFFLAGIYPVGMKIAADWFPAGLGKALGFLVGALVLGTALPHGLRAYLPEGSWKTLLWSTSAIAALGGLLLYTLVPDGPHRKAAAAFQPAALKRLAGLRPLRAAAFGYFGHMWELYTFWALLPALILWNANYQYEPPVSIALWSFLGIGAGAAGCVIGGIASARRGSARVARLALCVSGACCLLFPLLLKAPAPLFLTYLFIWGAAAAADSPQFSTLVAQAAPAEYRGTALTLVTSVGFALTIVSVHFFAWLLERMPHPELLFLLLAAGPFLGVRALRPLFAPVPEKTAANEPQP
jgi:MFS family permease